MARAILYDSTLCVGCRECEKACSEGKKLPYNEKVAAEETVSSHKLTAVRTHGERFSRKLCMHCLDPACASVCPVAALEKTAAGPVVYHPERCMGCRYCMVACVYQVPSYQWEARLPLIQKCDMCADRTAPDAVTRCSEACSFEATITGERHELVEIARKRMAEKPNDYYPKIYGIEEVGGTSVLVIAGVPFEQLGYPSSVAKAALPNYTWAALQYVPDIAVVGAVLLGGIHWITHRREEVSRVEGAAAGREVPQ
ncbi:MAG: 4Fe-4S dicluster domain-containing protein [Bryobacteraceae bacterium]|nr:4Fe-4S dicluster domain-containing protein [Bryobacteraceae bacterium]